MSCLFTLSAILMVISVLGALFETGKTKPEPKYRADGYLKNWNRLAAKKKAAQGWRCQECRVDCSGDRTLVQVHHINRNTKDNSDENLIVLCIHCHSRKPGHGHLQLKHNAKSDGRWARLVKLKQC